MIVRAEQSSNPTNLTAIIGGRSPVSSEAEATVWHLNDKGAK